MSGESFVAYLAANPPRCLDMLRPVPVDIGADRTTWRVRCACGSDSGMVLGHLLADLKPGEQDSALMVSPLHFRCAGCERGVVFLDTDLHGEGAEFALIEGSADGCAAYRGEGEPAVAACPSCGATAVRAEATFTYHEERIDDYEADPAFSLAEFFDSFDLNCTCQSCGLVWEVTTLDTKL